MASGNKGNIPAEIIGPVEEGKLFGRTIFKWNGGEYVTKRLAETAREKAIIECSSNYQK